MSKKVNQVDKEKRVYQISLLLRRKPIKYIVQYISVKWAITERQAYNYIALARKEWRRYFEKLQGDGISYHLAQLRDLKDQAYEQEDLRLVLDIVKEEAKLLGLYPAEKYDVTFKIPDVVEVVHFPSGKPPEIKEDKGPISLMRSLQD
jgi:hypothetical protein